MTVTTALIAYLAAASLLTVTPGVDTAMVLRAATAQGPRPAALAALGIGLGCLAWGAAVSLGLGALIAASPLAYAALKWLGAGYLFWLGLGLLLRPRNAFDPGVGGAAQPGPRQSFVQGFATNLLNPKVGVFYVTFLPQFIPAGVNPALFSFLLAAIHVVLGLAWFAALIAASLPLSQALRRPAVIRTIDRLTGGVFIAFGVRLVAVR